jgi:hypothetical protein
MCETGGKTNFIDLGDPPTYIGELPSSDTKRWVFR